MQFISLTLKYVLGIFLMLLVFNNLKKVYLLSINEKSKYSVNDFHIDPDNKSYKNL